MAIMSDRQYSLYPIARVLIETEIQPLSLTQSQVKTSEKFPKTDVGKEKKW
jgi:hypothetical protein